MKASTIGRSFSTAIGRSFSTTIVAILAAACATSTPAEIRRQQTLLDAVRASQIVHLDVPGGRLVSQFFSRGSARSNQDETQAFETWRVPAPTLDLWYSVLSDARARGVTFVDATCGGYLNGYTAGGQLMLDGTFVHVTLGMDSRNGGEISLSLTAGPAPSATTIPTTERSTTTAPVRVYAPCPPALQKFLEG